MSDRLETSASKWLRTLLSDFLNGKRDAADFCGQFELEYNLNVDRTRLSHAEIEAFGRLFDQVIYYSPFPDERAKIPNYKSEVEIRRAAEAAASLLAR